jgi:hypothetical protein
MSAGLPGLGLGGLFFIFSALLAPFPELWRTLRGRSDLAAWKTLGRQLAQALAMVAAIDLTLRLTYVVMSAAGVGDPPPADEATVLPLNLIGITTGLLVLVLGSAKLVELALRLRSGGLPRVPAALPRVAPFRAVMFAAVAVVAWVALLATGASELSPLKRPQREQIASRPEPDAGRKQQRDVVESRPEGGSSNSTIATEVTEATGTPNGGASPDGDGGRAATPPSPAVSAPEAQPTKPPPPAADPAPPAPSQPKPSPAPPESAAGGGPPESAGPPEGVPASEGAGAPAEPPPQAPAKGLRSAG